MVVVCGAAGTTVRGSSGALTTVLAPKGGRKEPERLELIGSPRDEPGVTTSLVPGGKGLSEMILV